LEDFRIPRSIVALRKQLEDRGYEFVFNAPDAEDRLHRYRRDFPFKATFTKAAQRRSPLEHLLLACKGRTAVGGAIVSHPGAPTDWPLHACDCGLFGPIGVAPEHRGGTGKVLLFHAIARLRELNFAQALIPTSPTIYPFYTKAGFHVHRIHVPLERQMAEATRG